MAGGGRGSGRQEEPLHVQQGGRDGLQHARRVVSRLLRLEGTGGNENLVGLHVVADAVAFRTDWAESDAEVAHAAYLQGRGEMGARIRNVHPQLLHKLTR